MVHISDSFPIFTILCAVDFEVVARTFTYAAFLIEVKRQNRVCVCVCVLCLWGSFSKITTLDLSIRKKTKNTRIYKLLNDCTLCLQSMFHFRNSLCFGRINSFILSTLWRWIGYSICWWKNYGSVGLNDLLGVTQGPFCVCYLFRSCFWKALML